MDALLEVLPLALLDSLSVSTLAVPLWFLLTPGHLRLSRVHWYLGMVAVGYVLLGCLLLTGVVALEDDVRRVVSSPAGEAGRKVLGAGLVLAGAWHGLRQRPADQGECSRLGRRRDAAVGETATGWGLALVAVVAVLLELPTMLPYLLAVDTLGGSGLPTAARVGVLVGYCLVMVAPAVLLTVLRGLLQQSVLPGLRWVQAWLRRSARQDTPWFLVAAGVLLLSSTGSLDRLLDLLDGW